MKEKHELKLMDKIYDAYGKKWEESEINSRTNKIKEKVQFCCENSDLVSISCYTQKCHLIFKCGSFVKIGEF